MSDRKPETEKKRIAAVIGLLVLAVLLCSLGAAFILRRGGAESGAGQTAPASGETSLPDDGMTEHGDRLTLGASEAFDDYSMTVCTAREGDRSVSGRLFVPSGLDFPENSPIMILCPGAGADHETLHSQAAAFARAGLACMTAEPDVTGEASEPARIRDIGILIRGLLSRPDVEPGGIILAGRDTGALTAGFAAAVYRDAVSFVVLEELPLRLLDGTGAADLPDDLELPTDFSADYYVTGDDERYSPLALLGSFRGPGLGISGEEDTLKQLEDENAGRSLLPGFLWSRLESGSYPAGAEADSEAVCAETASLVMEALRTKGLVNADDAPNTDDAQESAGEPDGQESGEGEEDGGPTEEARHDSGSGGDSGDSKAGSNSMDSESAAGDTSALLPAGDAQGPGHRIRTVACIGDSLTTGYRLEDPDRQCYPAHLQKLLGKDYQVINYGKGGYSLSGPEPVYTEHSYYRKSQKLAADYYVILLGTNDAIPASWNAEAFELALREMIGAYRRANPESVIILMTPSRIFRAEPEDGSRLSDSLLKNEIIPIIEAIAPETNCLLIDLYGETADRRDLFLSDELHPTEEGARFIAGLVADVILG